MGACSNLKREGLWVSVLWIEVELSLINNVTREAHTRGTWGVGGCVRSHGRVSSLRALPLSLTQGRATSRQERII